MKQKRDKIFLWIHIATFLVVMLLSARFGETHWAEITLGFVIAYSVPAVLSRILLNGWSQRFGLLLLGSALVMSFGITQNLTTYVIENGNFELPGLGWEVVSDASRDYESAMEYFTTGEVHYVNKGYPMMIGTLFSLAGVNLAFALQLNMAFALGVIAMSGAIATLMMNTNDTKRTAFWGALLTAAVSSIIFYGTVMLKDICVTFGVVCCGYAFARIAKHRIDCYASVSFICGGILLALLKSPIGWFIALGAIIILATSRCRKERYTGIAAIALSIAISIGGQGLRSNPDSLLLSEKYSEQTTQDMLDNVPNLERYSSLVSGYYSKSIIERVALLPLTAAAQYFPPFPWNFSRDLHLGGFYWYPHIAVGWYLLGGLSLGFLLLLWWRKTDEGMSRWALWIVLCYLAVAFASAGSVARYYMPFIPLCVPLALRFAQSIADGSLPVKSAKTFSAVYITSLIAALCFSYWFLKL